jgi:UDPglucose 6-dehydrogenase
MPSQAKIAVIGLFHLGLVTATCVAKAGFDVVAYDPDEKIIADLKKNIAPIFEPGVNELLAQNNLKYTADLQEVAEADILWITYDTPVDDDDQADVDYVKNEVIQLLPFVRNNAVVLISSQLPVGSTKELQEICKQNYPDKQVGFAYSPENLRLGKSIEVFTNPDRIIVGVQNDADKQALTPFLAKLSENLVWMSVESAEMTKHALNTFLAMSVTFANELGSLCEYVGADPREVELGLKSEMRIGKHAYIRPGSAFAGGTLARDVMFLKKNSKQWDLPANLFNAIIESNNIHKQWAERKVKEVLGNLEGKTVAVLGLTYKANTNTLRRSSSIETCKGLFEQNVKVKAFDPAVKTLPNDLKNIIQLEDSALNAIEKADAIIVATEWGEFKEISKDSFEASSKNPVVFDANGYLSKSIGKTDKIRYFSVGESA